MSHLLAEDAVTGQVVGGKYRVERVLAKGGVGVVYVATQLGLDRHVALKMLQPSAQAKPEIVEHFEREARLCAQMKSDHVVRIHDVGSAAGFGPYMVMELLEGDDLDAVLAKGGALAPELAVEWVMQACAALAEAHALHIVHRDVKPENLFLAKRAGRASIVKLLDFGISKVMPKRGEQGGWTHLDGGTPAYMAPEQLRGSASDARADIWALGVVLYELLTGELPFPGATVEEVAQAILDQPPRPMKVEGVPAELRAILARCLAKNPDERIPDAATLARELAPFGPPGADEEAISIERVVHEKKDAAPVAAKTVDPRRFAPTVVVPRKKASPAIQIVAALVVALAIFAVLLVVPLPWKKTATTTDIATATATATATASETAAPTPTETATAEPTATATETTARAPRPPPLKRGTRPVPTATGRSAFGERQ